MHRPTLLALALSRTRFATAVIHCGCLALVFIGSISRAAILPAGTKLEVRLSTPAGSRISRTGDPVSATLIAPVVAQDRELILEGAKLSGTVEAVQSLGLGLRHAIAQIKLNFNSITLSDGSAYPISGQVCKLETARERVDPSGNIDGIEPTANVSSGMSFAISTLLLHTELAGPSIAVKLLAARSPDSEIYLPIGTEMTVELTAGIFVDLPPAVRETAPPLSPNDIEAAHRLLNTFPGQQTLSGKRHPSDLVNLLLLGSADQVDEAFRRARWTGESKRSLLVGYRMYRCLVQRMGYSMAPMANLTLNGVHATRSYQKSLDTLAKRHHVRLWRQQNSNIWLAAATEDIGIIFRHMHMTHAIDPVIDNERAKVVNDLWFTGCVETASLLSRNLLMPVVEKGVPMVTDENIAVVRLQDCEGSNTLSPAASSLSRMRQAFAAVGIDVARANPATLALITFRTIADRKRRTYARHLEAQAWRRPSVVDKSRHDPERPDAGPVEASAHGQREPDSLQAKAATAE